MFFDDLSEISQIASKNGTSIFVVPEPRNVTIKNAIVLEPDEKTVITIEQVRGAMQKIGLKQVHDQYVLIRPADALGEEAANAILKNLEEPGEKVHFVLVTSSPSRLLQTVLSRASIYFYREEKGFDLGIKADEKSKALAKRLITASGGDLVTLAEEITKRKTNLRSYALEIVGLAIEMLYKSYFITNKDVFVRKLPKFLALYEHLMQNGHVKLQIVASLI